MESIREERELQVSNTITKFIGRKRSGNQPAGAGSALCGTYSLGRPYKNVSHTSSGDIVTLLFILNILKRFQSIEFVDVHNREGNGFVKVAEQYRERAYLSKKPFCKIAIFLPNDFIDSRRRRQPALSAGGKQDDRQCRTLQLRFARSDPAGGRQPYAGSRAADAANCDEFEAAGAA
ncbi:hypothetical protein [Paenibacillus contaminans]|uniref:hypothetical protein n=1 Tax=Paenibacillus contaminans TaxID=450362 RepID=UPI001EDDBBBC|nr:hypothetical protein [Paenibacillus contaminans]